MAAAVAVAMCESLLNRWTQPSQRVVAELLRGGRLYPIARRLDPLSSFGIQTDTLIGSHMPAMLRRT